MRPIHARLPALAGALAMLAPAAPAWAQLPPPLPGVIERVAPPAPPDLGPSLLPPEPEAAVGPGAQRAVRIGRATIAGNQALPDGVLRQSLAAVEGRSVTLAEVEAARLGVLRAYREAGFPYVAVAASLVAEPDGAAGLRILITEGFVADLLLEGEIEPAAQPARQFLQPLVGERPLPGAALERALLLASDIPGVTARGVLRPLPGEPGALQLVVRLERRAVTGFFSLDNRGFEGTGAWQGLLVGQLNSLTSLGERTEVALLGTDGAGQGFVQVTEELFLGASGLRLRAYAGAGRAVPGSPLAAIGYVGDTRVAGAALLYPLIRSRPLNLTLTAGLDAFESTVEARDAPGLGRTRQGRDAVRVLRFGVEGAALDGLVGFAPVAASTAGSLRLSQGIEALGASADGRGSRPGSESGFTKLVAEVTRLQPLAEFEGWLLALQGSVAGQWSEDVLPPAEKFFLGGTRLGRGFYAGQVTGDRAVAGSLELQLGRLFEIAMPAGWPGGAELRLGSQFYLFRDMGWAEDNGPAALDRRLSSWGGGVRLQFDERVQLDLEGVRRITRRPDGVAADELSEHAAFVRLLVRF
ncbi:ShlB/FhaC/HecB family hemolysin secretion/activation protein [Falsiroseomonas oryziterrae]|uniref:ShlB/FhaC/HecB family hemolysin secretion/activation protein n=1 Tax=Falsiroseomonas oryziterrae TaxID=2911368 RepID=UPI001EFFDD1D|nr:ShlB/FhaC/HecB family hemolysin secretion/activation protein [Roseomonas sp. NPKOSM-4]